MSEVPAASVVIPVRNGSEWIGRAIRSVGDCACDIIVVDDGSQDGTGDIVARMASGDSRIRLMRTDGIGASAARNQAIEAARTEFVAFLDADDQWRPGKLAAQLAFHRSVPGLGLSFTDYRGVEPGGYVTGTCFAYSVLFRAQIGGRRDPFVVSNALAHILAENVVGTSTAMARTALLREAGGFETSLCSAEDWDLWLKLARIGDVGCIPAVMVDYTARRSGSLSTKTDVRARAVRTIADRHKGLVAKDCSWALKACAEQVMIAEAEALVRTDPLASARLRLRVLGSSPSLRNLRDSAAAMAGVFRRHPRAAA